MEKKIIYDFGMNNGDDLPYYLCKADKVIGVEANIALCNHVKEKYKKDVASKKLVIINCALADKDVDKKVSFFIHKEHHYLSKMEVESSKMKYYKKVEVPQRTASSIIFEYGEPHYVKIDIEDFDLQILREMHREKITPPYISAEIKDIEIFNTMVDMGYKKFNIIDGHSVERKNKNTNIINNLGEITTYSFPMHTAGPFGKDIKENPWMNKQNTEQFIGIIGIGWKDLHATFEEVQMANRISFVFKLFCHIFSPFVITLYIWRRIRHIREKDALA